MLSYKKITEHTIHCPHCNTPIVKIKDHDFNVLLAKTWLQDGDTIFGLWYDLIDAGRISVKMEEHSHPDLDNYAVKGIDYHLWVGEQPCCNRLYQNIDFGLVEQRIDHVFKETYFLGNRKQGKLEYYLITNDDLEKCPLKQWIATYYVEANIPFLHHHIGLFTVENPDDLITEYGVSACSSGEDLEKARRLVFNIWDDVLDLQQKFHKEMTLKS